MTPGALVMQRFLTAFHVLVLTALAAGPAGATVHGEQADAGPEGQRQVPDEGWSAGYDGTDVVCELDSSGNLAAHSTYGAAGLVSRRVISTTTYYAFDAHGSVSVLTDSSGDAVSKHGWDAYGTSIGTAPSGPFGYGAQWGYFTDSETGLCALAFRAYDPATGRFLTRDPIGYAGGVNLYGYVGNGPAGAVDPLGLRFTFNGVPQKDAGAIKGMISQIEKAGPNGKKLIEDLRGSHYTIRFKPVGPLGSAFEADTEDRANARNTWWGKTPGPGSGGSVYFNPFGPPVPASRCPTADGSSSGPLIQLAHELGHAWRTINGQRWWGTEEDEASNLENWIRLDLGLSQRTRFGPTTLPLPKIKPGQRSPFR